VCHRPQTVYQVGPAPNAKWQELQPWSGHGQGRNKGIGPGDVADHLGISRTLLDLRFRETGNVSVGRLILELRLNALAALIAKSRCPLLRAIGQCGFGSINLAKAVFKKRLGMTMREYRNGQTKP
jgi:LacI family transcriptional regulator